jgi:inner membrane protein
VVRAVLNRPVQWIGAFFAACIAVVCHLLLDLTNPYGIRLLLPFSERWLHLDITNVVDLWIWAILLLCVLGPLIGKLVAGEITSGAVRQKHHGRGFAIFGLAFLLLYNTGRGILHSRATAILDGRIYRDAAPLRVAAIPGATAPWRWRGLVETADFYAVTDVDLTRDFDPTKALILHKPEAQPAIEAAQRTPDFREFLRFSLYPFWRVSQLSEPDGGKLVEAMDLRFGDPQDPAFVAAAVLDAKLAVERTEFHFSRGRPRP